MLQSNECRLFTELIEALGQMFGFKCIFLLHKVPPTTVIGSFLMRCFVAGGRDTAGLGGKGGPYRLDAGHKVHQVSQAEKDAVPEEVRRAAREMGEKAFKER